MSRRHHVVLAYPGSLQTLTGGYVYDRRLAQAQRDGSAAAGTPAGESGGSSAPEARAALEPGGEPVFDLEAELRRQSRDLHEHRRD